MPSGKEPAQERAQALSPPFWPVSLWQLRLFGDLHPESRLASQYLKEEEDE